MRQVYLSMEETGTEKMTGQSIKPRPLYLRVVHAGAVAGGAGGAESSEMAR